MASITKTKRRRVVRRTQAEVLTRWIAALRSGKYKQGTNTLRAEVDGKPRFCCLGVLGDLAVKDGGPEWGVPGTNMTHLHFGRSLDFEPAKCSGLLPPHVWNWVAAGIGMRQSLLVDCNDYGWSFKRIADYIEREARKAGVLLGGGKRRA